MGLSTGFYGSPQCDKKRQRLLSHWGLLKKGMFKTIFWRNSAKIIFWRFFGEIPFWLSSDQILLPQLPISENLSIRHPVNPILKAFGEAVSRCWEAYPADTDPDKASRSTCLADIDVLAGCNDCWAWPARTGAMKEDGIKWQPFYVMSILVRHCCHCFEK